MFLKPNTGTQRDMQLILICIFWFLGLSLEESTDLPTLHKKHDRLERTLKELNISLKTRFLPKTQKLQLKDTLDKKVSWFLLSLHIVFPLESAPSVDLNSFAVPLFVSLLWLFVFVLLSLFSQCITLTIGTANVETPAETQSTTLLIFPGLDQI